MNAALTIRPVPPSLRPFLESIEGVKLVVYPDSKGIATCGIGHADRCMTIGSQVTQAQVSDWYKSDTTEAAKTIAGHVPYGIVSSLPEKSYTALLSFVFNVGSQAFVSPSTGKQTNFSRTLNSLSDTPANYVAVAQRMKDWDKATIGGKLVTLRGLTNRRAIESSEWLSGFAELHEEQSGNEGTPEEPEPASSQFSCISSQATTTPDFPVVKTDTHLIAASTLAASGSLFALAPQFTPDPSWLANAGARLVVLANVQPYFAAVGGALMLLGATMMLYRAVKARNEKAA